MRCFNRKKKLNNLKSSQTRFEICLIPVTKPKYAWITTHTCRWSFCTNEFLAGTPPELIMKISGHKSLKDFYKYIRITPEEAGRQVQEIWEKRGEMKVG